MISFLIDKVKVTPILKNLMVLVSGSAIAQLIGVLAAPLLSRLYSPEEFGVIGSILAVVTVVSVVSSLKYEMALVIEKDDSKAQALQVLCWRLLLVTTGLTVLAIISGPWWLHQWTEDTTLLKFLPWTIPIVFLTGLFNIYNYRLNRERRYKSLSVALITRRLSLVGTQVILGFCGAHALGLVLGSFVGSMVAVVVLLTTNSDLLLNKEKVGSSFKEVACKHYRFPVYSSIQNLLNTVSQNLPIYLLGYFYGMEVVGAYWFALRLLQLPAALVGQAVRQVYYKEASDLVGDYPKLRSLYIKTTGILTTIMVLPVLVMSFFGVELFVFCFGEGWTLAGEFARGLFFWVATGFINPPAAGLFYVLGKQRHVACVDFFQLLARFGVLAYGGSHWGPVATVVGYSVVGVIFNSYLICYWFYFFTKCKCDLTKNPNRN